MTAWMSLEDMVSMEISQAQKDKHYCNLVCGIEKD
jgi:hypothetical protein